ncbi:hypothetical protein [Burkholderia ambifaria]|uniref:hypothetical protein n=1 Tax=Burkholderia ambifaria TaxID=152480 RepID=UPI000B305E6C|nr:hypothetical protein [Burkholderia ambifaria]
MNALTGQVTSVMDRESVVFEIWCGDRQLAEISKEPGSDYAIDLYVDKDAGAWHLNLRQLRSLIDQGIKELESNP